MEAEVNSEMADYLAHFAKFTEVNLTLVVLKEWCCSLHKNVSFDLWRTVITTYSANIIPGNN